MPAVITRKTSAKFENETSIPDRLLLSLITRRYQYKNEGLFVDLNSFALLEIAKFAGIMSQASDIRNFEQPEWNKTLNYLDWAIPDWRNILPVAGES